MKKLVLFFAVVLALVLVVPVGAQGPAVYNSGFQVQNLSAIDDANVVIEYYNMDGTIDTTFNGVISAGSSTTYFPVHASAGFDGSVVISSDQPIAAITNVIGDGIAFNSSYSGFSSGDTVVNLPLLMRNNYGFDTWLNVQNVGTAATTVTLTYANDGCFEEATIQPGAAARFDQATSTCMDPAGEVDAGQIVSTEPIVATVIETTEFALFAYNGFLPADAAPDIVAPLVQSLHYGYSTGIQIQNNGGTDTDVVLTYTSAADGTTCTEDGTIAAGKSVTFGLGALAGIGLPPGTTDCTAADWVGGMAVTSNSAGTDLVAIINQFNFVTSKQGAASNSFNPANATDMVMFPLIAEQNYGFFSGFNVMNVGVATTTVVCTFANDAFTETADLAPGAVMNAVQYATALPDGYVGSATCDGAGVPLIGVANYLGAGNTTDVMSTYDGFNN